MNEDMTVKPSKPPNQEEEEEIPKLESPAKGGELKQRRKGEASSRRRSLSPLPYPGAKPITTGLYLEPHHLGGKIYKAHHRIQIPVYFFKWILGQMLSLWSFFFWHVADCDDDIVKIVEETALIIVLRRDADAEQAEKDAFSSRLGSNTEGAAPLLETRHYYVDMKRCDLELIIREAGATNHLCNKGKITPLKSWSMRYTKSRRREGRGGGPPGRIRGGEGTKAGAWQTRIESFVLNGNTVYERERMCALLFVYQSTSAHTKSHVMGNALSDRILLDDRVRDKLAESTWTTTALHYGLVYGTLGPLTTARNTTNQWMGLGYLPTHESLMTEIHNMTALGANHGDKKQWADLELPFADFLLNARLLLSRVMKKNSIPPDLHEAIFLSCIVHATDHIQLARVMWGKVYNVDPDGAPGTWIDHHESCAWRFMWGTPTLNPIWNNKLWRIRKPFYRQLYLGLKEIDTFNVADQITASIMY